MAAMRTFILIAILLHLQHEVAYSWFWPFTSKDPEEFKHEHIKALTADTFEDNVIKEDGRYYFIKFYANWCGHCKTMAPKWAQVAAEVNDSNLQFMQVECSNNDKLCRKAAVKGFPEIKVFYNGRIGYQATGGMELEELRSLVREAPGKVQEGYRKAMELEAKEKATDKGSRIADEL